MARDVRKRLAQHRDELFGDAFVDGVDRTFELQARLEAKAARRLREGCEETTA